MLTELIIRLCNDFPTTEREVHLASISTISPLYLPCISPVSPHHRARGASRLDLHYISPVPPLYLPCISPPPSARCASSRSVRACSTPSWTRWPRALTLTPTLALTPNPNPNPNPDPDPDPKPNPNPDPNPNPNPNHTEVVEGMLGSSIGQNMTAAEREQAHLC